MWIESRTIENLALGAVLPYWNRDPPPTGPGEDNMEENMEELSLAPCAYGADQPETKDRMRDSIHKEPTR